MKTVVVKIIAEIYNEDLQKIEARQLIESVDVEPNEDTAKAIDYALELADDATKWAAHKAPYNGPG